MTKHVFQQVVRKVTRHAIECPPDIEGMDEVSIIDYIEAKIRLAHRA